MSHPIAVVGAGIAGLACARRMRDQGADVVLFDKGTRAGGRASTRLHAGPFDHGAQFFTAHDPRFREAIEGWIGRGWVEPWGARFARLRAGDPEFMPPTSPRYVGVPDMGSLPIHLADDLDLRCPVRIATVEGAPGQWQLRDEERGDQGLFDTVVVATPAPQAEALLVADPDLARAARDARLAPCWALMLSFDGALDLPFDAAEVEDPVLSWIARDGSKPGRPAPDRWVAHAGIDWSRTHEELPRPEAEQLLAEAFARVTGDPSPAAELRAHRWRYARVETPVGRPHGWNPAARVGACGDWWLEGRVEAAWISGHELAGQILADT